MISSRSSLLRARHDRMIIATSRLDVAESSGALEGGRAGSRTLRRRRASRPLGGAAKQLAVARNADGRLEFFYIGTDDRLYHNWQTAPNNGWSGEAPLGGALL